MRVLYEARRWWLDSRRQRFGFFLFGGVDVDSSEGEEDRGEGIWPVLSFFSVVLFLSLDLDSSQQRANRQADRM